MDLSRLPQAESNNIPSNPKNMQVAARTANQSLIQARAQRDLTKPSLDAQSELAKRTVSALESLLNQQQHENSEFSAIEQPAQQIKYLVPGTNEEMTLTIKAKPVDPLLHAKKGLVRATSSPNSALTALNLPDPLAPVSTATKAVIHRTKPEVSLEEKLEWKNMPKTVVSNWKNRSGALIDLETRAKSHPQRQISVSSQHLDFAQALDMAEQETNTERSSVQSDQQMLRKKLLKQKQPPRVTKLRSKPKSKPKSEPDHSRIQFEPAK